MTTTLVRESELSEILARALGEEIRSIEAAPHPYATSHLLVDVDAELADGSRISAVVKETGSRPPHRPRFVHRARRERDVYRCLLRGSTVPAPRLLGVTGAYIVLERVVAAPLWETADERVGRRVGHAIRSTHEALSGLPAAELALVYDAQFYDCWLRRARTIDPTLAGLACIYDKATTRLLREPATLIHGELYPSNVLVGDDVWIVDWESLAVGPAVIDLAAIISGWSEPFGQALLESQGAFDPVALDCARLHLAIRWLGWSHEWRPPPGQTHDWKCEAEQAAERLRETLG